MEEKNQSNSMEMSGCIDFKLDMGSELNKMYEVMMLDNNFINHLQKQMGKKIVSKFVKMDKEEADKLHNALIKKCTGEENA